MIGERRGREGRASKGRIWYVMETERGGDARVGENIEGSR